MVYDPLNSGNRVSDKTLQISKNTSLRERIRYNEQKEQLLFLSGRAGGRCFIRLGVKGHISKKTLNNRAHGNHPFVSFPEISLSEIGLPREFQSIPRWPESLQKKERNSRLRNTAATPAESGQHRPLVQFPTPNTRGSIVSCSLPLYKRSRRIARRLPFEIKLLDKAYVY